MNDTDKNEVTDNQLPPPPAEIPLDGAAGTAPDASEGEDMGMFSPKPETPYECAVAAYLEANASDALRDKIREAQKNGKGIAQCYEYITAQARKEANGSQSVMIADAVVYGWAVHYFEDEWLDELERDRKAAEERKANAERIAANAKKNAAKAKARAKSPHAPKTPLEAAIDKATGFKPEDAEKAVREAAKAAKAKAKAEAEKRKSQQLMFQF